MTIEEQVLAIQEAMCRSYNLSPDEIDGIMKARVMGAMTGKRLAESLAPLSPHERSNFLLSAMTVLAACFRNECESGHARTLEGRKTTDAVLAEAMERSIQIAEML